MDYNNNNLDSRESQNNLDLETLNDRIQKQSDDTVLYQAAFNMLHDEYHLSDNFTHTMINQRWGELGLSEDFLHNFANKAPTPTEVFAEDSSLLDELLQDSMYLVGIAEGIMSLQEDREAGHDCQSYIDFVMEAVKEPDMVIAAIGFASLTLLNDEAPSDVQLLRMFPITKDREKNQESMDLIAEINANIVKRYGRRTGLMPT